MKTILTSITAGSLLTVLAMAQPPRFTVRDLGPVGDYANSGAFVIRDNGLISGSALVASGAGHAVFWYKGLGPFDIGNPGLGGPNSVAFGVNDWGQFVGQAETRTEDSEDFCAFKASGLPSLGTSCVPFVWQFGRMTPLPTLGGKNGAATAINNFAEVAGYAETTEPNSDCNLHQFKPVAWKRGRIRQLNLLQSVPDRNGFAYGLNDNGQIVGASGDCVDHLTASTSFLQPLHALLWQKDGTVVDLGNNGGTGHGVGTWAISINSKGHVVGSSDTKGDQNTHAFLWTRETGMRDLGALPGDFNSGAIGINDAGDIVGISIGETGPRGYLWQKGVMTDLNTLIPADSPFFLLVAGAINASGEIIGAAFDTRDEKVHAFLAIPRRGSERNSVEDPVLDGKRPIVLPEHIREMFRKQFEPRSK